MTTLKKKDIPFSIKTLHKRIQSTVKKNSTILKNFSYLSALQIFNLILPLRTYPYLIRVLGKEVYGIIVFAQAITSYFAKFINYGFNISATKDIAINQNNHRKKSEIISSVFILKGILFLLSLLILLAFMIFIPIIKNHYLLFLLTFHLCFYEFIFPQWYFQGIEKMKYIAIINFISRYSFVVLIFIFVNSKNDYFLVPAINGLGSLLAGILSLVTLVKIEKVRFFLPSIEKIKYHLKEGFPFFISTLSTQLYTNANKIFIGIFLNMQLVAMYDIAEKLFSIVRIPVILLGQSIYPKNVRDKNVPFIKKTALLMTLLMTSIYFFIFIFAGKIVLILGGENMTESTNIVRVLLFSIIPVTLGQFFCTQTLIPFGYKKQYTKILIQASIIYFISIGILYWSNTVSIYSFAGISILVQIYISIYSYYSIKHKYKIW